MMDVQARPEIGSTAYWRTSDWVGQKVVSGAVRVTTERDGVVSVRVDRGAEHYHRYVWVRADGLLTAEEVEAHLRPVVKESEPFADLASHWNVPFRYQGD